MTSKIIWALACLTAASIVSTQALAQSSCQGKSVNLMAIAVPDPFQGPAQVSTTPTINVMPGNWTINTPPTQGDFTNNICISGQTNIGVSVKWTDGTSAQFSVPYAENQVNSGSYYFFVVAKDTSTLGDVGNYNGYCYPFYTKTGTNYAYMRCCVPGAC